MIITPRRIRSVALLSALLTFVTACGGGGGSGSSASGGSSTDTGIAVAGRAIDGPVVGADIVVVDASGRSVARFGTTTDEAGKYAINLPANTEFPVELRLTGGTDRVTQQPIRMEMRSLVLEPDNSAPEQLTAHINPSTTLIVAAARAQAGNLAAIDADVLARASRRVARRFDLTVTEPVTNNPEPSTVRAFLEEQMALGEALRRGSVGGGDLPQQVGATAEAVGADVTDGNLDGRSGGGVLLSTSPSRTVLDKQFEVRNELEQGVLNVTQEDGSLSNVGGFLARFEAFMQEFMADLEEQESNDSGSDDSDGGDNDAGGSTDDSTGDGSSDDSGSDAPSDDGTSGSTNDDQSEQDSSGGDGGSGDGSSSGDDGSGSGSGGGSLSVTLEWRAPQERVDGSPLSMSNLDGYVVSVGPRPGDYSRTVEISDAYKTSHTLRDLRAGTHYAAVRAFDATGRVSAYSGEVEFSVE